MQAQPGYNFTCKGRERQRSGRTGAKPNRDPNVRDWSKFHVRGQKGPQIEDAEVWLGKCIHGSLFFRVTARQKSANTRR